MKGRSGVATPSLFWGRACQRGIYFVGQFVPYSPIVPRIVSRDTRYVGGQNEFGAPGGIRPRNPGEEAAPKAAAFTDFRHRRINSVGGGPFGT